MLRKRSRAVGGGSSSSSSKQGIIMSEPPLPLNQEKLKSKPMPGPSPHIPPPAAAAAAAAAGTFPKHFPSPKSFSPGRGFDSAVSPTSILPTPFFSDPSKTKTTPPPPPPPPLGPASKGLVEALTVDADDADDDDHHHRRRNLPRNSPLSHEVGRRMVLFASKLKIQIPSPTPPELPPQSPIEFGFKNKESQLALLSPAQRALRVGGAANAKLVVANLVVSDLELSEDYTCVISHGPNPKTTHIFDNCIIENRRGGGFLSSCHACNKRLGQGEEIFMYRGEKAFCSSECRHQEMLFDEAMD